MKIIYLHQYFVFPNQTGGTRSYDLATKFQEVGIQVEVVSASSDKQYNNGKRWNRIEKNDLVVHYIYLPYSNELTYLKRVWVFFRFLFFSTFKLFSLQGDMLLATSTPLTIGIPALFNKKIKGIPYIFEVRDVWPEAVIAIGAVKNKVIKRALYFLERIAYKNASAIVPLSTDMKKSILSRYPGLKEKPMVVIENIAEINRFRNTPPEIQIENVIGFQPRFSILYAGTFGKVNGIEYVIQLAAKTLTIDPTLVFLLMGNGAEKEQIKMLAIELGVLNKNIFILDSTSKNELPKWYAVANMGSSFVIDISELWANSANKFFDTLAAGKPILINHEGWQADIIREANIGYVLPPKLTEDAASEFVKYTYNNQLIGEQSINALETAKAYYSLEVASNKYTNLINKLLGKN